MSSILDRLKKLRALCEAGTDPENEAARELLLKLISKYRINIEDLDDDTQTIYTFIFHGKEQRKILLQVIYKVTDNKDVFYTCHTDSGRQAKSKLAAKCTKAQKAEIDVLFDFYSRLYENDLETFVNAFIQKHRLFGRLKEGEKPRELPLEEILRLESIMRGLSNEEPRKQITSGS